MAKDGSNISIDTKTGTFKTTGVSTAVDEAGETKSGRAQKIIREGRLLILQGWTMYNAQGMRVE